MVISAFADSAWILIGTEVHGRFNTLEAHEVTPEGQRGRREPGNKIKTKTKPSFTASPPGGSAPGLQVEDGVRANTEFEDPRVRRVMRKARDTAGEAVSEETERHQMLEKWMIMLVLS